jgi:HEAT repeat protein
MIQSSDPSQVSIAIDILGRAAISEQSAFDSLLSDAQDAMEIHPDSDVAWSVAHALRKAAYSRSLDLLSWLGQHYDPDVRFQAMSGIANYYHNTGDADAIPALLHFMDDDNSDVKDWATFEIGSGTDIDTPEVRAALWERVRDADYDTRAEAIMGLARRGVAGVVELLAQELSSRSVGKLMVAAAAEIASPQLLQPLQSLTNWWDVDPELLRLAIQRSESRQTYD